MRGVRAGEGGAGRHGREGDDLVSEPALIYAAIPKVMADVGAVAKTRKNQAQGYQFRGIDDIYHACQPAFVAHGVFVVPRVLTQEREERQTKNGGAMFYVRLTVEHRFFASDGSSVECVTIGEAMDSGDKATNKAMSAAMKYALIETLAIPTEGDDDTENHSHEVAPKGAPPVQTKGPVPRTGTGPRALSSVESAKFTPPPGRVPGEDDDGPPSQEEDRAALQTG